MNFFLRAEDIVQNTFFAAAENIHSFKHKSNPKTWLFSILNNIKLICR